MLKYQDKYKRVFDYEPPDFSQKKEICKIPKGIDYISVTRL
jgi:hypothetical protein